MDGGFKAEEKEGVNWVEGLQQRRKRGELGRGFTAEEEEGGEWGGGIIRR